ncbi:MAG: hypothetical protein KF857_05190 [Fimbriimonadaceae bacterium]|nr:hypothetical protein [Fimbriimonadaceae bacterium]
MADFIHSWLSSTGAFEDVFPEMFAMMAVFGIPIIAILTAHQRKMAQIIHERHNGQQQAVDPRLMAELASLRAEIGRLRDVVNQQVLAHDSTYSGFTPPVVPEQQQEVRG